MSTPIDDTKTLTASGGGDATYSAVTGPRTDGAKVQVEIGGATTDADIFVEGRLDLDIGWSTLKSAATVANGYSNIWTLDVSDLYELRIRVVNNDGTNGAEVTAVVRTD